jgi:hypothetical protein
MSQSGQITTHSRIRGCGGREVKQYLVWPTALVTAFRPGSSHLFGERMMQHIPLNVAVFLYRGGNDIAR